MRQLGPLGGIRVAILAALSLFALAGMPAVAGGETVSDERPLPPPPAVSAVEVPPGQIETAVGKLDALVADVMARSGVPGISVAVVHGDEIVYSKGFGVRRVGSPAPVDANTVFQLASISKPLGSSVVARVAERRGFSWDDPVAKHLPGFRLSNPFVSRRVTIADLYSHRSGLPDHAGDLLEDLGYGRNQVLRRLRFYDLAPFRATYAYTNFGMTAAAEAAARAAGRNWAALSRQLIYRPLGMASTSSRFADYRARENRADLHVRQGSRWQARYLRNADAQSPAGGASSSALDMARWMRMILANGRAGGSQILRPDSVLNLRTPRILSSPPPTAESRSGFYALGMNVGDDSTGRVRLSHSGAFALGAATSMMMVPAERLGIIALTNGQPTGAPEAIAATFLDYALLGRTERDWYPAYNGLMEAMLQPTGRLVGRERPRGTRPTHPLRHYAGTYRNRLYGPARVVARRGHLILRLGPKPLSFRLTHWRGNTFAYHPVGENAAGLAAIDFRFRRRNSVVTLRIEDLDHEGKGLFTNRSARR
jgi:CubicO group peptidase (beta-lactamase class C family)